MFFRLFNSFPNRRFFSFIMRRRRIVKFIGRKRIFLLATLPALYACWWLSEEVGRALMLPPLPDHRLQQFRVNRSLHHYIDNINLLIEPSTVCKMEDGSKPHVVIMVTSAPSHRRHRDVIRDTWGKHQLTYFFLGLRSDDDQMVDTYVEAKQHSDLVVHDFQDHYQNLTLKVALMLHWTLRRCSHAEFIFKTDDDVLVNPWTLYDVIEDNKDAALFGYKKENSVPHRDEYNKWYLPRWLYNEDLIPEYLSGTGYIIKGNHLPDIVSASLRVPIINMEDVYFTYLVAKQGLGIPLTHDRRLSPYKPWTGFTCPYKTFASIHSLSPDVMERIWPKVEGLAENSGSCSTFDYFSGDFFLF